MIDLTANDYKEEKLRPFIKAGATFQDAYEILYYTRLFKYIHHSQYKLIDKNFPKIASKKNLQAICELGYLKETNQIYRATNESVRLLEKCNLPVYLLPENEPEGNGGIDERNNTAEFINATKLPKFYTLCYPFFNFGRKGLCPDALMVEKDGEKYKLTFLEIEAEKDKWEDYLEGKRSKYLELAKDIQFYEIWKSTALKLRLRVPEYKDVGFTVTFVCSLQKDFGEYFKFVNSLA